jgi:thiol-disulfide isomerase/thioredoxin
MINVITLSFENRFESSKAVASSMYGTSVCYDEAVKIGKPIVVTFYADWCGYCKRFAPVQAELKQEYSSKYTFVNVNADYPENKSLLQKFNIKSYPSLYLVNPNTSKKKFVSQRIYTNKLKMEEEFDSFLK